MKHIKKLLILSSGGDAPGMNAAIRAAVRTSLAHCIEIYGAQLGYQGLIDQSIFPLSAGFVANSIQRGGTILQTGRCEAFKQPDVRDKCREYLNEQDIDGLIVIGGNGSFRGASLLSEEGGPDVIGIPCTIDNDIHDTEYTIGFDTARNTALHAIDKIRDTASSFNRNFLVEVMGRASGFLAVDVGIAGGAEFILIPEAPITVADLVYRIQNRSRQKLSSIIVVAEANVAGRSFQIAEEINKLSGIEYKVCVLGHTQRGGSPTVMDRKTGSIMGAKAAEALREGLSEKMIAVQNGKIIAVDFPDPDKGARCFSDLELLKINEIICNIS